jgi:dienelactone hydrolase
MLLKQEFTPAMARPLAPRLLAALCTLAIFFQIAAPLSTWAAPQPQATRSCLTFTEAGAYSVCDDSQANFRAAFTRWGLQRIGYPISNRYERDGFVTQAFQKGIMQWREEQQTVVLVNIFDDLHATGADTTLYEKYQTPRPLPANWDGDANFDEVIERRQALLAERPALERAYRSAGDPLTFFGLPTSEVEDMGNHYAIRLQRAVLQEWKETVPWARAGEVTISNGGEIARALGILPVAAGDDGELTTVTPSDPDEWLTVESLRARTYGGEGEIERVRVMEQNSAFTRYEIRYPSDGLMIGGFMNVPTGRGPFPVILVNHGFMPRDTYDLLTYTTKYADLLAQNGYLVLHTNYRNHRGSDRGPDQFRVGYAIDVLNLIEYVKELPEADADAIGMWGHSMGGGITLRTLAVSTDIKAALVYGSMSSDETETVQRSRDRMNTPNEERLRRAYPIMPEDDPDFYRQISPFWYLDNTSAAIAIHHGVRDDDVPYIWSERLRDQFLSLGAEVEFYAYADQPHNFVGAGYELLNTRTVAFFDKHLK